jgi:DNA helicase-2/ATP-dependent DNA helicase PcrA
MRLVADLHIHSRFSRATSRALDFVALHRAALEKGIGLVGTGDFTHPGWMAEIREQLQPAEQGFYRLRPDLAHEAEQGLPQGRVAPVRFVLQVEISNIYKKSGRVRKNHNLVFAPTLEAAQKISVRLAAIGNLASDGRPILGLDARDLLQITLDAEPSAFLIPAHIWTPWFSLLGSKSGFDSLDECFGDMSGEVFAVETGLSSDPAMNWRLSALDRFALISNSDAHSPAKIGREANVFDTDFSYRGLVEAIRSRDPARFTGTVEFFPEEGKYHWDGHRKCEVVLDPRESFRLGDLCPACGKKLTIGVAHRVEELADRTEDEVRDAAPRTPFRRLIPLNEVIAEACEKTPESQGVWDLYFRFIREFGNEQTVLTETPASDLRRISPDRVAEGIERMRKGLVRIAPGHDGEYGKISLFGGDGGPSDASGAGQLSLF